METRLPFASLLILLLCVQPLFASQRDRTTGVEPDIKTVARVSIRVSGQKGDARLFCRIRLDKPDDGEARDWSYKPFFQKECEGEIEVAAPPGRYELSVEKGPEYVPFRRKLVLKAKDQIRQNVRLRRWINLNGKGWWSGDLHIHRKIEEIPTIMRAEDLNVAPVSTQHCNPAVYSPWSEKPPPQDLLVELEPGRAYHLLSAEDERHVGCYLYHNLKSLLNFDEVRRIRKGKERQAKKDYPSAVHYLDMACKQPGAWPDISNPYWPDVPALVATGKIKSIEIANNASIWCGQYKDEAWGVARDRKVYPAIRDNGFYSQDLYYRFLNCGFRIAPAAGSASGVMGNYVGYNRAYVHLDGAFSYEVWWDSLAAGRVFVTNGPVLLVQANGVLPGAVFKTSEGAPFRANLDVWIGGNDPIESVEVIKDGRVVQRIREGKLGGKVKLDPLAFDRSGWFLVRAIARVPGTFRFASTGPFYVEAGEKRPRPAVPADAKFFIEWIERRIAEIEASGLDQKEMRGALKPQRDALAVFLGLLEQRPRVR